MQNIFRFCWPLIFVSIMKYDIKWKIWLVVGILLITILVNGLVGYLMDRQNIHRLDIISHTEFPAAQNSNFALESFKSQLRLYEDAVMTGEWNLFEKAWVEKGKVEKSLKAIIDDDGISREFRDEVSNLLGSFLDFSIAADYVYGMMGDDNPEGIEKAEKMTPELSERKKELLCRFVEFSETLSANLHNQIDHIQASTRTYNYILLIISFTVILVALITTAFIVNMAIIKPVNAVFDELSEAQKDKELEAQLYQRQKLESLGELSAGVAHEINNPVGFIGANLSAMQDYVAVFQELLDIASEMKEADQSNINNLIQRINELDQKEDFAYIFTDMQRLLDDCLDGTERVTEIVSNLKSFARPDAREMVKFNIIDGLNSTLKILQNELKYKCNVIEKYNDIPSIVCHPGEINQVFINLISNAAQAIEEQGDIIIKVWASEGFVYVEITDTGCGMPPEFIKQIFDPFFTTKPPGKGTGLGLSVSHGIIKKHEGKILVQSEVGKGSTFTVILPVMSLSARKAILQEEQDEMIYV